ncbi:MAG: imidazolonepropionase, partial [Acidobacteria bacterium]|nr:imidazolonepropionase [Acidobacteriota bacterium]
GAVACRDGRIVFVGTAPPCRRQVELRDGGEEIDCSGQVILPGLIDAHTHLPFAGERAGEFRLRLQGKSYEEIAAAGGGILSTVVATREATDDDLLAGCRTRMDRMLAFGVTTAEAKSGYGLSRDQELRLLRVVARAHDGHPLDLVPTLLAAHVLPPEFKDRRDAYVDLIIREIIPAAASEKLARFCDVFVEDGAFSVAEARAILAAGREAGMDLRVHVDQLTAGGGAELAAEMGAASADHLEHVSPAGMQALAAAGTVAVLLPVVDLFLRKTVYPPVAALLAAGVDVALATDCNPGSCMTENLPLAASLACLTTGLDTDDALAGITARAAHSLRLEDRGTLDVGAAADLAVFAVADRTTILYHFGINHCRTVVKNGQVVMRDGTRA